MSDTILFEHFNPELELGSLDEYGRPIRPRKKPGRKPKPPSPTQRKAQNRAAQRAFRERKRRETREAEAAVKRSLLARDQAIRQTKKLARQIKELEYENNYLKGHVLSLKLACYAHHVDVHNFSLTGERDHLGTETMPRSTSKGIPSNLEFFLGRNMHVISLTEDALPKEYHPQSPESSIGIPSPLSGSSRSDPPMFNPYEALLRSPYLLTRMNSMPGSFDFSNHPAMAQPLPALDLSQAMSALAPQLDELQPFHPLTDTNVVQGLMQTQLVSDFVDQITRSDFTIDQIPPELAALIPPEWLTSLHGYSNTERNEKPTSAQVQELWHSLLDQHPLPPSTKSRCTLGQNGERLYPPMTVFEYIEELRLIPCKEKKFVTLLEPTELQRNVPHDIRIDLIPGADMRDQMILFQGLYDANEMFSFLLDSAIFMGGTIGNQDNWFVPPSFLRKYWFLCPSQIPDRADNSVKFVFYLGEKMQNSMMLRKQKYMDRERYAEHFPPQPTIIAEEVHEEAMLIENEGLQDGKERVSISSQESSIPVTDDMPLDVIINVLERMPRFTSLGTFP